jgi:RNA polymerase sigma factor for flagellar operon FliA
MSELPSKTAVGYNPGTSRAFYVVGGKQFTREEMIHKYMHLVKYVAGRVSVNLPSNVEMNDLVNDGVIGLIDAIEKFEDGRGVKFETYAVTRIHGSIVDALRALDWVSRKVRQKSRELDKISTEIEVHYGRQVSDVEVADRMGVNVSTLNTLQSKVRSTSMISLDDRISNETDTALIDTLRSSEEHLGFDLERTEIRKELMAAVEELADQERIVITLYYFERQSLKEIKEVLDVSESRVSQIHAQAVIRLRQTLRSMREDLGHRENDPTLKKKYNRVALTRTNRRRMLRTY